MSIAKRTSAINRVENGYVFTEHQRSYNPSKTFTVGRFLQEAKACLASIAITKQCQFLAAGCDFLYVRSSVDRTRKATAKLLVCRTLQGLETMEGNAVGPFQSVFRRCNPDAQLSCFDTFGREWQAKSLRGECCWLRSIESKKNQYIYIYRIYISIYFSGGTNLQTCRSSLSAWSLLKWQESPTVSLSHVPTRFSSSSCSSFQEAGCLWVPLEWRGGSRDKRQETQT